ncbi:helix-turn-helix transcriptional regulator [Haloferula sargassicola]|uniref:HTH cro/C1-type domain-containing protein n=1 Tax=Haloferula sargassicola TaxID=490096 RepID=A0ABP9URZ8_9BACT
MKIIITKGDPEDPLVKAFSEPASLEAEIEFCKLEAVEELLQFMKREGINRSELAERMGVPPSRITKLLNGSENLTIATLVRAGRSVGAELKIRFQSAAKGSASKSKAETKPASKVAEDPTPYRAKKATKATGTKGNRQDAKEEGRKQK